MRVLPLAIIVAVVCVNYISAEEPAQAKIGATIPNLTFKTPAKTFRLHEGKDNKATVIVFLSFACPISNSYAKPLTDLANEFGPRGVAFIGVTVNPDETHEEIATQVRDFKIPFPVVKDSDLSIADALAAEITPEVFVLDSNFVLRYRGRIDNRYYKRLEDQPVTEHNLKQALTELLAGKPISVAATKAIGCTIQRPMPEAAGDGAVTYYRDVLPILQNRCQDCHRPGQAGPFALTTYREAVNWAEDIKTFTQKRLMPPWLPSAGGPFQHERRLSQKEIDTLAAWVDAKTPAGDAKDAPPAREWMDDWRLGTPDVVLKATEPFTLGPTGSDVFRCFVLPTNLGDDKQLAAVEVRPGNRSIVQHVWFFVDTTGEARKRTSSGDEPGDRGPGYIATAASGFGFLPRGMLSGWTAGQPSPQPSPHTSYLLPKSADVVVKVHYRRNGKTEEDQTAIGLYFAKEPTTQSYRGNALTCTPSSESGFRADSDFVLHSITPLLPPNGKEAKITLTEPGLEPRTLLHIKDWSYSAQESYNFAEPVNVKKGAHIFVDTRGDGADPCLVFLGGIAEGAGDALPLTPETPPVDVSTLLQRLEKLEKNLQQSFNDMRQEVRGLQENVRIQQTEMNGVLEKIRQLEGNIRQLNTEIAELRKQPTTKKSFSPPSMGRIRIINNYREAVVLRVAGETIRLAANQSQFLNDVPTGTIAYEIISPSTLRRGPTSTRLAPNELLTLTVR